MRSQVIQAAQTCPRLQGDVLGKFLLKIRKEIKFKKGDIEVWMLSSCRERAAVLHEGQETSVFEVQSLGFVLPTW